MAKNSLNGHNGTNGAKPEITTADKIAVMRREGWEQVVPTTGRVIRLRTVEAADLLRSGDCPDILTPLMLRSIYQELTDREIREWLERPVDTGTQVEDAIKYLDMLDLIAGKGIADDTAVSDLSLGEKKFIFRFVLGPSEMLVLFRYEPRTDVAAVAEEQPLSQAA
jgi:hypothetical protein